MFSTQKFKVKKRKKKIKIRNNSTENEVKMNQLVDKKAIIK